MDVQTTVKEFIERQFLVRRDIEEISEEDSLLDSGLIDSIGIFEIVSFLETQFDIAVKDEEVVPENFETIKDIVAFINTKAESLAEPIRRRVWQSWPSRWVLLSNVHPSNVWDGVERVVR